LTLAIVEAADEKGEQDETYGLPEAWLDAAGMPPLTVEKTL